MLNTKAEVLYNALITEHMAFIPYDNKVIRMICMFHTSKKNSQLDSHHVIMEAVYSSIFPAWNIFNYIKFV